MINETHNTQMTAGQGRLKVTPDCIKVVDIIKTEKGMNVLFAIREDLAVALEKKLTPKGMTLEQFFHDGIMDNVEKHKQTA